MLGLKGVTFTNYPYQMWPVWNGPSSVSLLIKILAQIPWLLYSHIFEISTCVASRFSGLIGPLWRGMSQMIRTET